MIAGTVTASYEPVVRLAVLGPQGQRQEVEAVVDTGFTGSFTLPQDIISRLGLLPRGQGFGVLADGQRIRFQIFEAEVLWDEQPRRITVYAADSTPLLGMDLLDGHELTVQVFQGVARSRSDLSLSPERAAPGDGPARRSCRGAQELVSRLFHFFELLID